MSHFMRRASSVRWLLTVSATALVLGQGTAASAQDSPQSPASSEAAENGSAAEAGKPTEDTEQEIVITGSRIPRAGFDTLQPAVVVGKEQIEQRAATNIADVLNEQPAFAGPGASPLSIQTQAGGGGAAVSAGQNFVDLFGLGSQRTLTLVNGKRFVSSNTPSVAGPTSPGVQVDLNAIPASLIDRVETIAVGGAPIYGADAIAGTVNIILKRNFEGFEVNALAGISSRSDAKRYKIGALYGLNLADGRGNIVINAEYNRQDPLLQSERKSTALQEAFLAPAAGTSPFSQIYVTDARVANLNLNGIPQSRRDRPVAAGFGLRNSAGQVVRFDENGNLVPYDIGTRLGSPTIFSGGEGLDLAGMQTLITKTERYLGNVFLNYELGSNVDLHAEGWYSRTDALEPVNQSIHAAVAFRSTDETDTFVRNGPIPVRLDNPFLTDQARSVLQTALDFNNNGTPDNILDINGDGIRDTPGFYLARPLFDLMDKYPTKTRQDLYRGVVGLEGIVTLAGGQFRWDSTYSYGRAKGQAANPAIIQANYSQALDAVAGPGGTIVCRNPANGCSPLNLFGYGAPSEAAKNFVMGEATVASHTSQHDLTANLSGSLFSLPGGEAGVAAGIEYRHERARFNGNQLATSGRALGLLFSPIRGSYISREIYGELRLPFVSPAMHLPLVHELEIEGAARYVHNSHSGGDLTWTAGGRYSPTSGLTFRGNFTHSIRSPAITELFLPSVASRSTATDPCDSRFLTMTIFPERRAANCVAAGITQPFNSNISNALQPITISGNEDLRNEQADSWTIGAILRPRFIPRLTLAVDWVDIRLTDAIFNLNPTLILQSCYDSADYPNVASCDRFDRDASGQISRMETGYTNAGFYTFSGLTTELTYRVPIGRLGSLDLQANYFYLKETDFSITGSDLTEVAGTIGSSRHKVNAFLTWNKGPLSWSWNIIYKSGAVFSNADTPTTRDIRRIDDWWMVHTAVAYDVSDRIRVQLNVDNLFDIAPPKYSIQAHGTGGSPGIQTYYPSVLGRYFTLSGRVRF